MKRQDKYPSTSTFRYYNANPKGKITGDCVVRAICTAMERPYNEVYRELFEFSIECGLMLNDTKCYEKYLESKGWYKQKQPRKYNGTKYTGKEFCKMAKEFTLDYPERIIAHIGGHHIVAIVDGRVWDIWDSTDGCIGNYWTEG